MTHLTIAALAFIVIGFLGIIFIVVRKITVLGKLQEMPMTPPVGFGERIKTRFASIRYSTYRPMMLDWVEKTLRKFRILILKSDNFFMRLISRARERSQVWQIRSKAWMEHNRLKKKEKLQVLETLDKVEVSEALEKINQEVAKDEDVAFKEKVELISNSEEPVEAQGSTQMLEDDVTLVTEQPVSDEEKKYIDLIAVNHKDSKAYRALGFLYLNQKNYSDARACFRRVLKFEPTDEEVRAKLQEIRGMRRKKM